MFKDRTPLEVEIPDGNVVLPGIVLLTTLRKEYPEKWNAEFTAPAANSKTEKAILDGEDAPAVEAAWKEELDRFLERRNRVLLY